jgi:hypothetical protein
MCPLNTGMRIVKAIFAFGRMNPVTIGHGRVVAELQSEAQRAGAEVRLFLSMTHDDERNPLDPETKADFVRKVFPGLDVRLSKTVFTAALELADEGFEEGVMIVGEDRKAQFSSILSRYAGKKELGLSSVEVKAITRTDEDASASGARAAALNGDFDAFKKLSATSDEDLTFQIFKAVRHGLGVLDGQ